jgi:hypothetical protein
MSDFRVIQGCPCNPTLAPYIAMVSEEINGVVNSIYRGADAEPILRAHGHSSQAELYYGWIHRLPGFLPANPPGRSTHELRSDGVAYAGPLGRKLDWWQQGFDVNDDQVDHWKSAARSHGWVLFQPYNSGSEFHHLNFHQPPHPPSLRTRLRIIHLRATLPRH